MAKLGRWAPALFLLMIAACDADPVSGGPAEPGTSSASAPATAAGISEPPAVSEWVTTTDPATGVSFALPGKPTTESRPGGGTSAAALMYRAPIGPDATVAVTFTEAANADYSAEGLRSLKDQLADQLRSAGAEDFQVSDGQASTVSGHPALDYRLSFTARNGKVNAWFVRVIGNGTRSVQVQSIGFLPPDDTTSAEVIGKYHQLAVESVRFS